MRNSCDPLERPFENLDLRPLAHLPYQEKYEEPPPLQRGESHGRNSQVDTELPAALPVHIYNADLQGLAAVQLEGEDGEQYCVIDSAVIAANPEAREYANQVYIKAVKGARCCRPPGLAT